MLELYIVMLRKSFIMSHYESGRGNHSVKFSVKILSSFESSDLPHPRTRNILEPT